MRIAIFTDSYYPNFDGVATTIIKTTNELARRGHKIIIFAPKSKNKKWKRPLENHENINVHNYTSLPLPGYQTFKISIPNYLKTKKILNEFSPDVIHVHSPGPTGITGINLAKQLKKKLIMTYHTYVPDFLVCISPSSIFHLNELMEKLSVRLIEKRIDNFLKNKKIGSKNLFEIKENIIENRPRPAKHMVISLSNTIYNNADVVTTPSLAMKRVLKKENMKSQIMYLSNGIQCKNFLPKKEYMHQKKIIHVGRLSHEKNVDIIILAMKSVIKKIPDASLHIYGDGPALSYLKSIVKNEELEKNIKFHGFVDNKELPKIYREHDVFVTASTIETQGIVILEAMSCGLPVIGVKKLAIPDLVKNNENGYVVKPFEPQNMARAILRILKEPKKQETFGQNSIQKAKEHDFPKIMRKIEKLYQRYSN